MYGLVNQAIEDLVRSNHDDATWEVIKQRAEVQTEAFLSMEEYPDDVTYRLVQAAAEVLNTPPEEFPCFWRILGSIYRKKRLWRNVDRSREKPARISPEPRHASHPSRRDYAQSSTPFICLYRGE